MVLSKIGLVVRMANPLMWRTPNPERMPRVAHTLWNIRTPYPTAILCRCGRVMYRFGTDLRHRDGTRCGDGVFDSKVTDAAGVEADAIDAALGTRAGKIAHPSGDDGGCGMAWDPEHRCGDGCGTAWVGALKDGPTDLAARAKDIARRPCQHTEANDAGVCPCGVTITRTIYPDGRASCSWPDDCPTVDACARGCVVPARGQVA